KRFRCLRIGCHDWRRRGLWRRSRRNSADEGIELARGVQGIDAAADEGEKHDSGNGDLREAATRRLVGPGLIALAAVRRHGIADRWLRTTQGSGWPGAWTAGFRPRLAA